MSRVRTAAGYPSSSCPNVVTPRVNDVRTQSIGAGSMVVNPSTDSVPPQVKAAAGWAWRLIVIAAAAALVVYAVLHLKLLFVVIFVAMALTAILVPLRRLFERIGLNRALSTTATL